METAAVAQGNDWARSPCSSCRSSPCCTRLPLERFHIERLADFEAAARMLRQPRIEIGLYESGWWMAYYLAPCRFLDPLSSKCLIHGTERQPQICRDYSPVRCWYKRVFVSGISPDFIRFDARRLEVLRKMVSFDEAGELSGVPDWEKLREELPEIPPGDAGDGPGNRLTIDQIAPGESSNDGGGLLFRFRTPRTRGDLDVVRFRLGFQGVRIAVSPQEWATVIGDPQQALGSFIVSYEGVDSFLASFRFDERGLITSMPDFSAPAAAVSALP